MPKYKNIKTLAVITTASDVQGEHWVKVEESQPKPKTKPKSTKKKDVMESE